MHRSQRERSFVQSSCQRVSGNAGGCAPPCLRGLEVDHQLELGWCPGRQFAWLLFRLPLAFDNGAQQGSGKKRGDFGDALDQLGNVWDKLHNSVPKGGKDSFIPFTHGLFYEALPRQTGLFIS